MMLRMPAIIKRMPTNSALPTPLICSPSVTVECAAKLPFAAPRRVELMSQTDHLFEVSDDAYPESVPGVDGLDGRVPDVEAEGRDLKLVGRCVGDAAVVVAPVALEVVSGRLRRERFEVFDDVASLVVGAPRGGVLRLTDRAHVPFVVLREVESFGHTGREDLFAGRPGLVGTPVRGRPRRRTWSVHAGVRVVGVVGRQRLF